MAATLFFYDLETSGIYPDSGRIMQFAGQRTDLQLKPIGEPLNCMVTLTADVLPDPMAVLIHGITPQQTIMEGLTEAEFLKLFYKEVVKPDTTFVGFNNVRFDDEFIRYLNYRNMYDPYAWSWEKGSSRWDILDVVRLTRALRPDGIEWPLDDRGANVNRLELLTKANHLKHDSAHDAMSDVLATIEVAKLIKRRQPKLFEYMFKLRLKAEAAKLVNSSSPFIYTSSHYPSSQFHTTAVVKVADHPDNNCVMVYDLRFDPEPWMNKSAEELADSWRFIKDRQADNPPLPVKTLRLNRCPAIAPIGVIKGKAAYLRLGLNLKTINDHLAKLKADQEAFAGKLVQAVLILNREQSARQQSKQLSVDARLYEGFFSDRDRQILLKLHKDETPDLIRSQASHFSDERLKQLSSLYLARNYYQDLSAEERSSWDSYVSKKLISGDENSRLALYFKRIEQLAQERTDARSQLLLEDLKLYGESLIPSDIGG